MALVLVLSLALVGCGGSDSSSSPAVSGSSVGSEVSSQVVSSSSAAEPATSDWTPVQAGKLIMATEATFRPYEYLSGTDVVGVDIDIATEIANALGLELVVEEMPFDSIIAAVSTGKADFGAAGMSVTPERAEQVDFSIEYATSMQVILTRADSGITGEADLDGNTVGVQLGTVADIVLSEDYPDVKLEQYNRYTDALNDLLNGRLDAMVLDSLPAAELQKQSEDLVICENELFTDVYAICVQKGNAGLLGEIDTVLQQLMDDGKIEEFTAAHLAD